MLSRWLIEIRPGVFLGNPSKRVRDELWHKVTDRLAVGYVAQIWASRDPQGFDYRQYGLSRRMLEDFEGLALVAVTKRRSKNRKAEDRSADRLHQLQAQHRRRTMENEGLSSS